MGNSIGEPIVDGEEYTQVLKHDVMMKRAQGRSNKHVKNYRDRLFVLTLKALLYYDGTSLETRGDLKGIVILRNIIKIEPVNEVVLKKQNCFVIEHLGLSLFIVAKNSKQRDSWVEAIEDKLKEVRAQNGLSDSCPMPRTICPQTEQSARIWVKKYYTFEESHPQKKNQTIFGHFNLSASISNQPSYIKSIDTAPNDLIRLELDVVVHIFSFLTVSDVANVRCVCKRWLDLTDIGYVWSDVTGVKMSVPGVKSFCDSFGSYMKKLELRTVSGDITSAIFNASLLTHLHLEYTHINLAVLPKFMLNLTHLRISSCKIQDLGKMKIENKFEKLKYLVFHFRESYEQPQIENILSLCPSIENLNISGNIALNSNVFKDNPFLQTLKLEYVKLDGSHLTQHCPNLKKLSLVWSDFIGPKKGVFQQLTILHITYQNTCVYDTLLKLFRSTPKLTVLSLTGLLDMTVNMFNQLVPYFQNVTTLVIKRCTLLNNDCMVQIGNYCHELQELDLSDLGDISGDGIIALLVSAWNLRCLDLSCTKTDDKVFGMLVKRVLKLEKLAISACPFIQDESMKILSKISTLKHLDISECKYVSPEGLYAFTHHPRIKLINALNCQSIEKQEIILNQFSPHCHILY